jgi:glycosyltransferase involved in cell wall biosynthesis
MRIAQVAPLYESVPPALYGGTERIVSYLTEELVNLGHDVTLFASADSQTRAKLVSPCPCALWHDHSCHETLPHQIHQMEQIFEDVSRFDIIHFHCDYLHFPFLRRHHCPSVTTLHGQVNPSDVNVLFAEYSELPLVSVSQSQRRPIPWANWRATVYHGLPRDALWPGTGSGDYLAFLGRISPQKRLDRAIVIAREAGLKLRVAAKIYPEERDYFLEKIAPMLRESSATVEFIGEIGGAEKQRFLGDARALIFPIDWSEPFGLVMIEAMACGTPVIAWRNGAVPEIVQDGVTGFVVENIEQAVQAVGRVGSLSRRTCREVFDERFDAVQMARNYLNVYRGLVDDRQRLALAPAGLPPAFTEVVSHAT